MKIYSLFIGMIVGCVISLFFVSLTEQYQKKIIIEAAIQNYGLPALPEVEITYAYHNNFFGADWYGFKALAPNQNAAEWRAQVDKLYAEGHLLDNVEIEWISASGDTSNIEVKFSDKNK